ncbi:hypothetical protein GQ53DRAFT_755650 [Thozetella sp. PMI_491]|nr:hypothetical protein GQ53DRAFT_755650 [Thozetella sp. PMI_491]
MALDDGTGSISPLPAEFRRGQMAMAVVGTISLISSAALFLHITYRLLALLWSEKPSNRGGDSMGIDLSLGLSQANYMQTKAGGNSGPQLPGQPTQEAGYGNLAASGGTRRRTANPLLILIYNLILADVGFSATYVGNIVYLREDAIIVGSATCKAQGWLVTFGCLISSAFLVTLAFYTYLIVIRGWQPSLRFTIANSVLIWVVSIVVTCLGPIFSGVENYFVRQQSWCWIYGPNWGWRLSVYIWGFLCIFMTFGVYVWTFWCLHRKQQSSRFLPRRSPSPSARRDPGNHNGLHPSGHHPAFLIYPIVYMCCATPLTLGSITPLENSTPFMIFAGTLLASVGFCDALLWSTTIIFSGNEDMVNTGLDHFAFVRTPEGRTFGNMIWVQGGGREQSENEKTKSGGWWMLGRGRNNSDCEVPLHDVKPSSSSQHHVGGIQMDVSTSVVIEDDHALDKGQGPVAKTLEL